ncbi:glycosyltransferase [Sorangium cellulosum]|uniref:Glycosyltransferase n=1 Tax=Sorangium cellulosum TaxID=56 RepID=A0A4P2PWI0_SORCE|nr:glycosyltransferase family 4 protein [Sorangium cellulosum]AUX21137.1 glycosyltransferase [Sorangium cellulosum]
MRIVVVTTSYPAGSEDPSGHFVRSSAQALARGGADVHVIAAGGSLLSPPSQDGGLTVHRAGGGALFAWPGAAARALESPLRLLSVAPFAAGVLERLRALGPVDRAVAHWIVPCAWPLLLAGSRAPLEACAHGADVRLLLRAPRALRTAVVGALLRRGARFAFAARALRDALASSLAPEQARALMDASRVEPPAIALPPVAERARLLRREILRGPGERLAVVACRLIATKRVELAIEAARAVGPGLRLVVIGDGPERAALERLARRGDGARGSSPGGGGAVSAEVRFTGALPRREALAWIAAADVLLHPSSHEAAPTVVREARALGVPVIACDAGDVAAWARSDDGIVVAAGTRDSLAAALRTIPSRRSERAPALAPPS